MTQGEGASEGARAWVPWRGRSRFRVSRFWVRARVMVSQSRRYVQGNIRLIVVGTLVGEGGAGDLGLVVW